MLPKERHCRAAHPGAIVDTVLYLEVTGSSHTGCCAREEPLWSHLRGGGVRDGRERQWWSVQSVRSLPAERYVNAPRLGDCGNHGRHTSAAGRNPGSHQPDGVGNPRRTSNGVDMNRLLPHRGSTHPPRRRAPGRARCVRQCGGGIQIDEPAPTWPWQ